jgi:uncharacterized FlaG/YvyC family protein
MSDTIKISQSVTVPPVSSEFVDKGIWGGRSERPVETNEPAVKLQPQADAAKQATKASVANSYQAAESAAAKDKPTPLAQTNVRLKFEVDQKTKEVKVTILDPATHKVIRTIPAEELKNFKDGDMVELFT